MLPTADPFVALRVVGTNGDNYGFSTDDIIEWMRKLETDHPFELTACGFDFLDARSLSPPTGDTARSLAERMVKFCPDMNDATGNAILSVAHELSSTGNFFFLWD
ncbi:MAG TPA: DUF4253 domain-containing protein [Vineibacter sp.]|nr:DUF4253 domain-containing protein [Vineibacter sp.]